VNADNVKVGSHLSKDFEYVRKSFVGNRNFAHFPLLVGAGASCGNSNTIELDCRWWQAFIRKVYYDSKPLTFEEKSQHNETCLNRMLGFGIVKMIDISNFAIEMR